MSRNNSIGRYSQSTKPKEICILLVNDDNICRDIVSHILDNCRFPYEDFSCEREMDALNIIREKKDAIEAIITNVHRTYANKYGIIENIQKELKLRIILMLPDVDDMKKLSEDGGSGVTVYMMKSMSVEEFNTLWGSAMEEKGKRESSSGKLSLKKKIGKHEDNGNVEKKPRIVWTNEMHQKFLEAVDHLGHDKAFPKKIVEVMNVPGLTRENVASHLQKYRLGMKQAQEVIKHSSYDFTGPFYTSLPNFQDSHWNPLRIRPRNTTSSLFNLNCHEPKLRTFPNMPLLNTIQIKPNRTFQICSNEKKNILLSIDDNKESSNARFVGLRLTNDGKSVEFGQTGHFGVNEGYVLGNDDSTLGSEKDDWMSSIVGFLGVDESLPDIMSHRKPPPVVTQPPPPAGLEWTEWAEPPGFTQLPPPENEVGGNFEIFNDFGLGTGIDEIGVGGSGISVFDELLFDNQDLT